MKATELRLGNFITSDRQYFKEPVIGVVYQVSEAGICFEYNEHGETRGISNPLKHILPIPLTEEWLIRFGFKNITRLHPTFRLSSYLIEATLMRDAYNLRQIINKTDSVHLMKISYVHELQNAYFILRGSELEAKQKEG